MKKFILAGIAVAVLLGVQPVSALEGVGVGVILGEPTGLSVKKWVSATRAVDGAAAWSLSDNESFRLHADYLIHLYDPEDLQAIQDKVPLYYGAGLRVRLEDDEDEGKGNGDDEDTTLGVRIPVGLTYYLPKQSIDLFVEIVPVLDVVPDTDFDIDGAIGARFYFR